MFAYGAINILDKLNTIDYLVFGMESENTQILMNIAKKVIENEYKLNAKIYDNISNSMSFVTSKDLALKEILTDREYMEISKPNNILAIEYLKALKKINSKITPIGIKRIEANHNDTSLSKTKYSSATSIREEINNKNIDSVINYIPNVSFETLQNSSCLFNDKMFGLLRYKILTMGKDSLNRIYEVSEGLENKIYDSIITAKNYDGLINDIKSKRYTMSKIKRILIHILLGISKNDYEQLKDVFYARILKAKNKDTILRILSKQSSIPIITSLNDKTISNLDKKIQKSLDLDLLATNVYSILANDSTNLDLTNKI